MAIEKVEMLPRDAKSFKAFGAPVRAVRGAPPVWLSEVRARETVFHTELLTLAERIHKAERALSRLACLDHAEVAVEFGSFDAYAVAFEAKRAELRALYVESCR